MGVPDENDFESRVGHVLEPARCFDERCRVVAGHPWRGPRGRRRACGWGPWLVSTLVALGPSLLKAVVGDQLSEVGNLSENGNQSDEIDDVERNSRAEVLVLDGLER